MLTHTWIEQIPLISLILMHYFRRPRRLINFALNYLHWRLTSNFSVNSFHQITLFFKIRHIDKRSRYAFLLPNSLLRRKYLHKRQVSVGFRSHSLYNFAANGTWWNQYGLELHSNSTSSCSWRRLLKNDGRVLCSKTNLNTWKLETEMGKKFSLLFHYSPRSFPFPLLNL